MLVALDTDTNILYYIHGGAEPDLDVLGWVTDGVPDVRMQHVSPATAEILAGTGALVCLDPDCDGRQLGFRRGGWVNRTRATSGERGAAWVHAKGAGQGCKGSTEAAGVWHRWMTDGVLARADGHEVSMGDLRGARADVVVKTLEGRKIAIEAQNSAIVPATVKHRNDVHKDDAGMDGTLWLIHGAAVGFEATPKGWDDAGTKSIKGVDDGPLKGHAEWLIDLVWACGTSESARVGIVLGKPGEEYVRFVRTASVGTEATKYLWRWRGVGEPTEAPIGGYSSLRVREWSAPVSMKALGAWASGETRNSTLDGALGARMQMLGVFKGEARVSKDGERMRLTFAEGESGEALWNVKIQKDAVSFGLTAGHREDGRIHLTGPRSARAERWLFHRHGQLLPGAEPISKAAAA